MEQEGDAPQEASGEGVDVSSAQDLTESLFHTLLSPGSGETVIRPQRSQGGEIKVVLCSLHYIHQVADVLTESKRLEKCISVSFMESILVI